MPKQNKSESVLHNWVCELPFQMQALLMTSVRGADNMEKHNTGKILVRYLRGIVIKPAANWDGKNNNDFMWAEYDEFSDYASEFIDEHDEYPHHFLMHLLHCAEVIGYKYPDNTDEEALIKSCWENFYSEMCHAFHMHPETEEEMDNRLNDFGYSCYDKTTGTYYSKYKK